MGGKLERAHLLFARFNQQHAPIHLKQTRRSPHQILGDSHLFDEGSSHVSHHVSNMTSSSLKQLSKEAHCRGIVLCNDLLH